MPPKFARKWERKCPYTRFPLINPLSSEEYSVKSIFSIATKNVNLISYNLEISNNFIPVTIVISKDSNEVY